MSAVKWSVRARREFDAYLAWIAERDAAAALRIGDEIDRWILRLAAHPASGAPSTLWPGYHKHSWPKRGKFVLYRILTDHIEIAAFRDARQDNRGLSLS